MRNASMTALMRFHLRESVVPASAQLSKRQILNRPNHPGKFFDPLYLTDFFILCAYDVLRIPGGAQ